MQIRDASRVLFFLQAKQNSKPNVFYQLKSSVVLDIYLKVIFFLHWRSKHYVVLEKNVNGLASIQCFF